MYLNKIGEGPHQLIVVEHSDLMAGHFRGGLGCHGFFGSYYDYTRVNIYQVQVENLNF